MSTPSARPRGDLDAEVAAAAADWVTRQDAGLSADEIPQLLEWLAADPRHAEAFASVKRDWLMLNEPRIAGRGPKLLAEIAVSEARNRRVRNARAAVFGGVLAAAAVLVVAFFTHTSPPETASFPTVMSRPDSRLLNDGSAVELNAGAEVVVEYSAERRTVRLLHGEALFTVAKDARRPFVVVANHVEIRAIGTAFAVRHDPREVAVLVTEGRVAVEERFEPVSGQSAVHSRQPDLTFMEAGSRMVLAGPVSSSTSREPESLSPEDMAHALAWRGRRVEFTNTPLSEAVFLFNGTNSIQLRLADSATAELRITGIFWTDNPEGFARLLKGSLGINIESRGSEIIMRK